MEWAEGRTGSKDSVNGMALFPLLPPTAILGAVSGDFTGGGAQELAVATCETIQIFGFVEQEHVLLGSLDSPDTLLALQLLTSRGGEDHLLVLSKSLSSRSYVVTVLDWAGGQLYPMFLPLPLPLDDLHHQLAAVLPTVGEGHPSRANLESLGHPEGPVVTSARMSQNEDLVAISLVQRSMHWVQINWQGGRPLAPFLQRPGEVMRLSVQNRSPAVNLLDSCLFMSGSNSVRLATLTVNEDCTRSVHFLEQHADPASRDGKRISLENLHPSTALLAALPPGCNRRSPLVIIGQQAAIFPGHSLAKVELQVQLGLRGAPTACTAVPEVGSVVVGDATGGFTVLKVADGLLSMGCQVYPLATEALPCLPCHLAYISQGAGAGLLYAAGRGSPSLLLEVHQSHGRMSHTQTLQPPTSCCIAPIVDAVCIQAEGFEEGSVLMCCGSPPWGSVARARMAAALVPAVSDGEAFALSPRLFSVREAGRGGRDQYLALSFDVAGHTTLLDVRGTTFQEASNPGLALDSSTLLLARLPAGGLLQVTPLEMRIVAAEAAQPDVWTAPAPITLAAHCGYAAAVATGRQAFLFNGCGNRTSGDSGLGGGVSAGPPHVLDYPQQISAITLFEWPSAERMGGGLLWLAVGQWATNEIWIRPLTNLQHCIQITSPHGQPRSVAVGHFKGVGYMFVGSADGTLSFFQLDACRGGGLPASQVRAVRCGASGVEVEWLEDGGPESPAHIFATSDQALMVRLNPDASRYSDDPLDWLEAVRVEGSEGLQSTCGCRTAEMPDGRAWVSPGSCLTFGSVDPTLRMRIKRKVIGGRARKLVYQEATGCALVLSEDDAGTSWLHLFHAASLTQLARMDMGKYVGMAMCLVRLPPSNPSHPCTQVVLVSSYTCTASEKRVNSPQGWLHAIEIVGPRGSTSSLSGRYELVFHGRTSSSIPAVAFSLAAVDEAPPLSATANGFHASTAADYRGNNGQLVMMGSNLGVQLCRITLDTLAAQLQERLQTDLQELESGCDMAEIPGLGTEGNGNDFGDLSAEVAWRQCLQGEVWYQDPQELHRCITQLDVRGQDVACIELLGSATTYQVQPRKKVTKPRLEPRNESSPEYGKVANGRTGSGGKSFGHDRLDEPTTSLARRASDGTCRGALSAVQCLSAEQSIGALFSGGFLIFDHLDGIMSEEDLRQESQGGEPAAAVGDLVPRGPFALNQTATVLCPARLGLGFIHPESKAPPDPNRHPDSPQASTGGAEVDGGGERSLPPPLLYCTKQGGMGVMQPLTAAHSRHVRRILELLEDIEILLGRETMKSKDPVCEWATSGKLLLTHLVKCLQHIKNGDARPNCRSQSAVNRIVDGPIWKPVVDVPPGYQLEGFQMGIWLWAKDADVDWAGDVAWARDVLLKVLAQRERGVCL